MTTGKEIRIKWVSDESAIDKSIQQLQQKLVQMNRTSAQMHNITETGGTLSPNALKAKGSFESSQRAILERERRELDVSQRKEMQFLSQKEKALNKIKAIEGELSKKQQQKLKSLELEINMSAKKAMDIETTKKQIESTLGSAGGGGGNTLGAGGSQASNQAGQSVRDILKQIGIATIIKKTMEGVGSASSEIYRNEARMSRQSGNIMQGMGGVSGFDQTYAGKGISNSFFGPQRMRAARQAGKEIQNQKTQQDIMEAGGSAIMGAGLTAAVATAGPTMGLGTVAGLATAAGGGYMAYSHPRTRAGIRGLFSPGAGSVSEEQNKYDAEVFVGDYKKNLESEKKRDYFGQKGFQYLEGNRQGLLQNQRRMGLGDSGLQDFMTNRKRGIFTQQERFGASGGILGAGGSTAQAREGNQALAMERDYGIMSARNVIGKISKNVEGEAVSDQAVNRILSEAVAVGLDTSKFASELNKYVSITGDFIAASGASSPQEQARVAGSMGKFMSGRSMSEINAGKGAKDQMNNMLGSGGGMFRKQLQIGAMMRHPKLKNLSPTQQAFIAGMSPDQLRAGGEDIEALAAEAGYENYDDFLKATLGKKGIKNAGRTLSGSMESTEEETEQMFKDAGVDYNIGGSKLNKMIQNADSPERKRQLTQLSTTRGKQSVKRQMQELGGSGNLTKQQRAAREAGHRGWGDDQNDPSGTFGVLSSNAGMGKLDRGFGVIGNEAEGRSQEALVNKAFSPEIMERYKAAGEHTIQTTDQAMGKWENFMNAVALGLDTVNGKAQELMKSLSGGSGDTPSIDQMNQFMKNLTSLSSDDSGEPIMTRPPKAGK